MADYAAVSDLTRGSVATVEVDTPDGVRLFDIRKAKAGDRVRLNDECRDEDGILDLNAANILAVHLCVVKPAMSVEEVEHLDQVVWLQLVDHIREHTGRTVAEIAERDSEEAAARAAGFPVAESESVDGGGEVGATNGESIPESVAS